MFLADGGAVMAAGDDSEVAARPEMDRSQATSLVFDALTAVIPGLSVEALDERQELYADLALDSLGFVRLLLEFESNLGIRLFDDGLMTIKLLTVGDLIDLIERVPLPAAK